MKKYKWLLFDADDTVLDFLRSEHDALTLTLRGAGLPHSEDVISVYSTINEALWKKLELGLVEKERLRVQRFEELTAHYGWDTDAAALARAYTDHLSQMSYVLPGAYECCRALYESGAYGMYIITNGISSVQRARFGACAVKDFFAQCFISGDVGYEKPSRRFFDAVAAQIEGFDPAHALVIGDSLSSDIRGGREYGIDTCWLNRRGREVPSDGSITYIINSISDLPALLACVGEEKAAPAAPCAGIHEIAARLAKIGVSVTENCPIAPHASFRIGGPADLCAFPDTEEKFIAALTELDRAGVRTFVAGNGSDLLFDDRGFRGCVVFTTRIKGIRADGCGLSAACGESLSVVAGAARDRSLTGLEFSFGIPGCIGGAVFMNAGAYGGTMSDVVRSVRAYDRKNGKIVTLGAQELHFSYRHSVFEERPELVALSVDFMLAPGDKAAVGARMEELMASRKSKQPLEYPSAGSVFKRPAPDKYVGTMIEGAGLKGMRVGGAEISRKHAGFIINAGGATAADVLTLVAVIKTIIREKYQVELECEIRTVPEK